VLVPDSEPKSSPAGVRAPGAGSERQCPACGAPLTGAQRACSGRCRAILSRQRREQARRDLEQELRGCLLVAREAIDLALETVPDRPDAA
jgi:predicted nucleic acid-binding Zn ribbon protein